MRVRLRYGLCWIAALGLAACVSPLERAERRYRQGDVRGALEMWRQVDPESKDYERAAARLTVVEAEFERMLLRYEKRAEFFESEERLAEAVLYYRLAYTMDPQREALIDRVQILVRRLQRRTQEERADLLRALEANDLQGAISHASMLGTLDPFDPSIQIELRQLRAATGAQVLAEITAGETAYANGNRAAARRAFLAVLELDPSSETALGYLSYIRRFEKLEADREIPPPPDSISREEILAEGHYRSGRRAESADDSFAAIAEYEASLSINSSHAGAKRSLTALRTRLRPQVDKLYQLGKRYFQEEDLHNALRVWRRALSIDPTDQRTRENVERTKRMLARLEEIQTGDGSGS